MLLQLLQRDPKPFVRVGHAPGSGFSVEPGFRTLSSERHGEGVLARGPTDVLARTQTRQRRSARATTTTPEGAGAVVGRLALLQVRHLKSNLLWRSRESSLCALEPGSQILIAEPLPVLL